MNWTGAGAVRVSNLTVRYQPHLPAVLKRVSFELAPATHLGVVGRTGAGKSTLVSSFFRMVEAAEGEITIDGVNIASLGLSKLRKGLNVILQEPVLVTGTLRNNVRAARSWPSAMYFEILNF